MSKFVSRNSTNFQVNLNEILSQVDQPDTWRFLKFHQYIVQKYVEMIKTESRGLLIYHEMGWGKSILGAALVMLLSKNMRTIIVLPKSLEGNFVMAIIKYVRLRHSVDKSFHLGVMTDDQLLNHIKRKFKFVSVNASNMIDQVKRAIVGEVTIGKKSKEYDEKLRSLISLESLEHTNIIFDEAHIFFRMISNGSSNGRQLYDMIIRSKTAKLFFMTGTPINSHPFELVSCFNMLGQMPGKEPILPVQWTTFNRHYVNGGEMKNKKKFQNRINGLVSHVSRGLIPGAGSKNKIEDNVKLEFPELKPFKVEFIRMSRHQFSIYQQARDDESRSLGDAADFAIEKQATVKRIRNTPALEKPRLDVSSSYRVMSRQVSNYAPPSLDFSKVETSDIPIESPKYDKILKNIKSIDGNQLLYSQFIHGGGLGSFTKFLHQNGWSRVSVKSSPALFKDLKTNVDTNLNNTEDDLSNFTEGGNCVGGGISSSENSSENIVSSGENTSKNTNENIISGGENENKFFGKNLIIKSVDKLSNNQKTLLSGIYPEIDGDVFSKSLLNVLFYRPIDINSDMASNTANDGKLVGCVLCDLPDKSGSYSSGKIKAHLFVIHPDWRFKFVRDLMGFFKKYYFDFSQKNEVSSKNEKEHPTDFTLFVDPENTNANFFNNEIFDIDLNNFSNNFSKNNLNDTNTKTGGNTNKKYKYAIITGDVPVDEREEIQKIFNSKDNIDGSVIRLILVSSTGAEGLDLHRIRAVHIMEPYWTFARILQIFYRGVRNYSHIDLPEKYRNVQPFIYLSVHPDEDDFKDTRNDIRPGEELGFKFKTTDLDLFHSSYKNKLLIDQFMGALREVSIECKLHGGKHCYSCKPNNRKLYSEDFERDMKSIDPCEEHTESEVSVNKITIDGTDYYYSPIKKNEGKVSVFKNVFV